MGVSEETWFKGVFACLVGMGVLERQASPAPLPFPSHRAYQGPGQLRRVPGAAQGPCGAADTVLQGDQQTAAQNLQR